MGKVSFILQSVIINSLLFSFFLFYSFFRERSKEITRIVKRTHLFSLFLSLFLSPPKVSKRKR